MKKNPHVAVLMGGPSPEYEVSLKSGDVVSDTFEKEGFEVTRVHITKQGDWEIAPEEIKYIADCAFIALHGPYGEDGTVQHILESHGIPYTGSNSTSSALGMNKFLSLRLFQDAGISIPKTVFLHARDWRKDEDLAYKNIHYRVSYPMVVKPNNQGSSVGVYIANSKRELESAFSDVFSFSKEAIVQEFISGKEVTCGVLDRGWDGSAFPLLPTEIIPKRSHFFDYRAKYEPGASEEITPARVSDFVRKQIQKISLGAHSAIGARGISRTDMILEPSGKLTVLEINTIPGFTKESLIPKAAEAGGFSLGYILKAIVESALHSFHNNKISRKRLI